MRPSFATLLFLLFAPAIAVAQVRHFGPGIRAADGVAAAAKSETAGPMQRRVVSIDRAALRAAAGSGRLELPSTGAQALIARDVTERHRTDGIVVITGTVDTTFGPQSMVLTLGGTAAFGLIPQRDGAPLRLETRWGRTTLIDGTQSLPHFATDEDDFRRPTPPTAEQRALRRRQEAAKAAGDASAAAPNEIHVLVLYTPALVQVWGSVEAVLIRIAHLEEITNQAYVDSDVDQTILVVGRHLVDYSVNNDNDDALDTITGSAVGASESHPLRVEVKRLRTLYGADLVKLMRNFDRSTQNSCGVGWLGGWSGAPFTPEWGFSVTSDHGFSNDNCGEWTFSHELGHNMGAHHDVETTGGEDGAYPYSHGLRQTLSPTSGFATIMAYTTGPQVRIGRFSNPRQNACLGQTCGDVATADNARGLEQSSTLVAALVAEAPTTPASALSIDDVIVAEGASGQHPARFTLSLSAPAASAVTVTVSTMHGSATNADYVPQAGSTVVIPAGQTAVTHDVMIRGDASNERDEVFALNILSATNARIVDGQGVATITNDEPTPTLNIADVTVDEGNAGITQAQFTVSLSAPSTGAVMFDFNTHEYGASATAATLGVDYDAGDVVGVNIPPGTTSVQVAIPIHGDLDIEQEERFYVMVNNVVGAVVGDIFAVGRIRNDDGLTNVPTVAIADAAPLVEGNTGTQPARFRISLSEPKATALTIGLSTQAGTATAGSDFVEFAGSIVIPAGATEAFHDVAVIGDTAAESEETFVVQLSAGSGYALGDASATATIVDDDGTLPPLVARPERVVVGDRVASLEPGRNDVFDDLRMAGGTLSVVATAHGSAVSFSVGNDPLEAVDDLMFVTAAPGFFGEEVITYRLCEGVQGARCADGQVQIHFVPLSIWGANTSAGFVDAPLALSSSGTPSVVGAYRVTPLVAPETETFTLQPDASPESPWDGARSGTQTIVAALPAAPGTPVDWRIYTRVDNGADWDTVDVYVGRDDDGGQDADPGELVCANAYTPFRPCELALTHPGSGDVRYWVVVHNRGAAANDVVLDVYAVPLIDTDGSIVVTGPGLPVVGQPLSARVSWSDATLLPADRRAAFVGARGAPGAALEYAPFVIDNLELRPPSRVLASGETLTMALGASSRHDNLYIDVPAGATRLEVAMASAQDVDLYLTRGSEAQTPAIAAAPDVSNASASATGPGGTATLVVQGGALQPGRWYVNPHNMTAGAALVELTATIDATAPVVRPGSYFDAARSGHGVFLYPAGGDWAGLWYTYLQDGSPTWYYLQGPAPGADGLWEGGLYRAMWDGDSNSLARVGRVLVTPTGADAFRFSFSLDGETGSEPMAKLGRECPMLSGSPLDVSSHWFNPATAGTGHSVQMYPNYELYASFVYDRFGVPRFLTAEAGSFSGATATIALDQLQGFCPMCDRPGAPARQTVGSLTRSFAGGTFTSLGLQGTFAGPLEGTWSQTEPVQALGGAGTTQGCLP